MTEPNETVEADGGETERHATNLELFLDLVFVFAVGQIVGLLARDLTPAGFGRGLLLAWLVWWLWSQFAWMGTAVDLGKGSVSQVLVLLAIPVTLLMAISIPEAYGASGLQFAGAYAVVNLLCLAIQGHAAWSDPAARTAWLEYIPLAAIAPVLLLVGSFFSGDVRTSIWVLVALVNIASALAGGRTGGEDGNSWRIDPTHFAERHALFVIIVLGEVMVAIGVAASTAAQGFDVIIGLGVLAAAAVACAFWWSYFAFIPQAVEHALRVTAEGDRGRVARNLFTYWHFPVVFGILLYALVAKHVVIDPAHHLGAPDLIVLALGVALFAGGLEVVKWFAAHQVGPERPIAIVVVAILCAAAGPALPGAVLLVLVAAVLIVMQSVSLRRFAAAKRSVAGTASDPV
ncbi:MAG: low temperature requirement protein A [Actinomycetes bacterium]